MMRKGISPSRTELTTSIVAWCKQFRDMFNTANNVYGDLCGLDFDDSAILCVQFRNLLGVTRVLHAGVVGLPIGVVAEDNITDAALFSKTVKKLVDQNSLQSMRVAIALPGSKVALKQIKLEKKLSDDEAEARAWQEARKTFPELVKSLFLDYVQTEHAISSSGKSFSLTLIVARREDIAPRIESIQQAGLTTKIVDVDYYALARAYSLFAPQLPAQHEKKYIAVIDFNPHSILFIVMHQNTPLHHNRQAFSGDMFVPMVQRALGVEVSPLKTKPVFSAMPAASTTTPASTSLPLQMQNETTAPIGLTEDQKSHLVMTIRRLFQSFYSEYPGRVIEHIVITGRCALLPDIPGHIGRMLDLPITIPNPFASLKISDHTEAERLVKLGPAFVLSCGLAMRGIPLWK